MEIPPGIIYLVRTVPRLLARPVLLFATLQYIIHPQAFPIPKWISTLLSVALLPGQIFAPAWYRDWKNDRKRRKLGLERIPIVKDDQNWGGLGLGMLAKVSKSFGEGEYINEFFGDKTKGHENTFHYKILLEDMVTTFEPIHIKAILATQFDDYDKGQRFTTHFFGLLGSGIFNSDGDMWKFHRNLTRPFFTKDRIGNFDAFDRHAEEAITAIRQRMDEGNPIDFQDLASRITIDSAASVLLGKEMNSLSSPLPLPSAENTKMGNKSSARSSAEVFIESFAQAQELATLRNIIGDAWPLTEFWKDEVKVHKKVINAFLSPAIENAMARKKAKDVLAEKGEEEESSSLLDELVKQTEDVDLMKDETLNILVAAKDTTSATLTFVIYMLAEYPHVLEKLRKEILDAIGTNRPTYDDIKKMKYLRAVINETLRLYPPVPVDLRHSAKDTTLPATKPGAKPFFVPKDATIAYHIFTMHRRKDLWGPDALEFDPERFIDERLQKYLVPNPFIFLPFNAGPRICLGQQFAYNEISFFIIRLLQNFSSFTLDLDLRPPCTIPPLTWAGKEGRQGKEKLWPGYHLTIFIKGAMWIRVTEAADP